MITTNEHGTRVAGIIAAKTNNNGRGIAGIAGGKGNRGITVIPYCIGAFSPISSIIDDAIIDAVDAGARVIQLSVQIASDSNITSAINYASLNGVIVVCASGNDTIYPINGGPVSFPASLSNVIAVGAINQGQTYTRADFSNYGTNLNVVAPGVGIMSTVLNGGYDSGDGTSFAAPQVSAIAALIWSKYPNFTRQQVIDIIYSTSDRYLGRHNEYGYGLVNARKAVLGDLIILGEGYVAANTNTSYSIPTPIPTGVTFNGWTVTPSSYTLTSGTLSGNPLNIRFNTYGEYTLTAKFTLPDGTIRTDVAQVNRTPPAPTIAMGASQYSNHTEFYITSSLPQSFETEWSSSDRGVFAYGYMTDRVDYSHPLWGSHQITIMCRYRENYMAPWSEWSNAIILNVYNWAPAPQKDEAKNEAETAQDSRTS